MNFTDDTVSEAILKRVKTPLQIRRAMHGIVAVRTDKIEITARNKFAHEQTRAQVLCGKRGGVDLKQGTEFPKRFQNVHVSAHGLIPFHVGKNGHDAVLVTKTANGREHRVVKLRVIRQFQKHETRAFDAEVADILNGGQILGKKHLRTQNETETFRLFLALQKFKGAGAGGEKRTAFLHLRFKMRREHNRVHTACTFLIQKGKAILKIRRTVIDAGQKMGVQICKHAYFPSGLPFLSDFLCA